GVGVPLGAVQLTEPTDAQLPTTNSVPPRVMSRRPSLDAVNVEARRPANTEPAPIGGPCVTKALSLLTATFTVINLFVVSKEPQSAVPRSVYVNAPSDPLTAVPKVNVPAGSVSVLARR